MIDYNKTQPILELYGPVPQSEGKLAGIPHIVVRTTGCTHRCKFFNSWCDTWYTSIHPQKGIYTLNDVKKYFEEHRETKHLMLTGGSPTMHPELCNEIITLFKETHCDKETRELIFNGELPEYLLNQGIVTIETEGSHFIKTDYKIDLVSMSPKFSNSIPKIGDLTPENKIVDEKFISQHNKYRVNKEAIRQMFDYHLDYQFKPVCNPIQDPLGWLEIEEFRKEMNIPKNKTWIMPPGDSSEEIIKMLPDVLNFCGKNNYNFSGRDHIIAFGSKRCV